jgi:hypothetical protein
VLVLIATSAVAIGIALINLAYDLLRIIMVTDDCRLSAAVTRLRAFLLADARQVIGIFAVTIAVLVVATAVSLLGAWVLALVSWVPVIGIIVVPLQIIAWPIRALAFESVALTAISAYQTQYRRFGEPQSTLAVVPAQVHRA